MKAEDVFPEPSAPLNSIILPSGIPPYKQKSNDGEPRESTPSTSSASTPTLTTLSPYFFLNFFRASAKLFSIQPLLII